MEGTYILGNSKGPLQSGDIPIVELPLLNEVELHDWVNTTFSAKNIQKLIVEIDIDPIVSLKIAYHIRLSLESLGAASLIPILFVSNSRMSRFLIDDTIGVWNHIFTTKGIYFSAYNTALNEVEYIYALKAGDYRTDFLNKIIVPAAEEHGRHSIANIWGGFIMDRNAGTNALSNNQGLIMESKNLYFKYLKAKNLFDNNFSDIQNATSNKASTARIPAGQKRILLIDDEADKGWEDVLRAVFVTSSPNDFVVINEKISSFEDLSINSKDIIVNQEFDLYLVDLRLNGAEEDENQDVESFSGLKVLRKIKEQNQGNQVIVFTASNKAWNLKKLLGEGADGYYVKESPEYNFHPDVSKRNHIEFLDEVSNCFKNQYLKQVWKSCGRIKLYLKENDPLKKYEHENFPEPGPLGYQNLLIQELDSIFLILKSRNKNKLNFALLSIFKILEFLSEIFVVQLDDSTKLSFYDGDEVKFCKYDKKLREYQLIPRTSDIPSKAYKSTQNKVQAFVSQKLDLYNREVLQALFEMARYRNDYVHPNNRFEIRPLTTQKIKKWISIIEKILLKI